MNEPTGYHSPVLGGMPMQEEHESRMVRIARLCLLAGTAAALLFAAPYAWFPVVSVKIAIAAVACGVAAVLFVFAGGGGMLMRSQGKLQLILLALLPAVYGISTWYSTNRIVAFSGTSSSVDTLPFILAAFMALVLGFFLLHSTRSLRTLGIVCGGVALAALVFQGVSIGIGFSGDVFADKTANLIGRWINFGFFMGLFAVGIALCMELLPLSRLMRIGLWAALAASLFMLVLVNSPLIWWLLIVYALAIAASKFVFTRRAQARGESVQSRAIPWAAAVLLLVSAGWLAAGASLSASLTTALNVTSLDVRPALSTTYDIASHAHPDVPRKLLGSGPNTFDYEWLAYKPTQVNETNFWSIDFANGFSTVATALVTVGWLGVAAWFMPLLLVLVGLLRLMRADMSRREFTWALAAGLGSAYLWAVALLYVASPIMVFLACISTGAFLGHMAARRSHAGEPLSGLLLRLSAIVAAVALLLMSLWPVFVEARHALSYYQLQRAGVALGEEDIARAASLIAASQAVEKNGENLRAGVTVYLAQMASIAKSTDLSPEEAQTKFQAATKQAIDQGTAAIAFNKYDYRSHIALASVYDALNQLGVAGAREQESELYAQAQALNPRNPAIPLLMAQLEAKNPSGSVEKVTGLLSQSLTLKPNFTNALLFAVQLAVSQNDLSSAIQAQTAAVASAQQEPSLWYELGLLYYAGNDMERATAALTEALRLSPNYANAQYFLGLAHYRAGRKEDALAMFEALAKTNGDNAQVIGILANLKAGKDPLDGLAPQGEAQ